MDPQFLKSWVEICMAQGEQYSRRGELSKAEQQYLRALKSQEELLKICRDESGIRIAGEICEILADLNMQQGNMHGADVCYAKVLFYRNL